MKRLVPVAGVEAVGRYFPDSVVNEVLGFIVVRVRNEAAAEAVERGADLVQEDFVLSEVRLEESYRN